MRRKRVLFFAEAVTLAHVARPVMLARALASRGCDLYLACGSHYARFVEPDVATPLPLDSIGSDQFLRSLARGKPLYDLPTLRRYLREDLELIERIQPDLIVGDFRLSLSVSARLARVPYVTVSNAYWSPCYARTDYPLPVLPITRRLPLPIAQGLFNLARAHAFRSHCKPLNALRGEHGMAGLGDDIRRIYTDADVTLYADAAQLFPVSEMPPHHHFIGPLVWSGPLHPPPWWPALPAGRPIVYVSLGSSGSLAQTRTVVDALRDLPVTLIVSTAGGQLDRAGASNVFVADYLPGAQAAARAAFVVCNGGSPTSHQALAVGKPVLGIASNMDQFLNMQALVAANAGLLLRADRLSEPAVRRAALLLLEGSAAASAAHALAPLHDPGLAPARFAAIAQQLLAGRPNPASPTSLG